MSPLDPTRTDTANRLKGAAMAFKSEGKHALSDLLDLAAEIVAGSLDHEIGPPPAKLADGEAVFIPLGGGEPRKIKRCRAGA